MFTVIKSFYDLHDLRIVSGVREHHLYKPGDIYPRKGYKPSSERVRSLLSEDNPLGTPLIRMGKPEKEEPKEENETVNPNTETKPAAKKTVKKKTSGSRTTGTKKAAASVKRSSGTAGKTSGSGRVRPVSRLNK